MANAIGTTVSAGTTAPKPPRRPPKPPRRKEYSGGSATRSYNPSAVATLAPVIDAYLREQGSPLSGLGRVFVRRSKKYGLDPRLLVAIAGAESSFGKHQYGSHNPFGMGPGINYPSYRAAIDATARNLSENYFHIGLDTIPEIQGKWAPSGAANDPTNLNSHWTKNVTKFYKELSGRRPGLGAVPRLKGLSELIYRNKFYKNGQWINPIGGHDKHVHFSATNPRLMLAALRWGQNRGLRFGENPYTDPVDPVHTGNSYHYRTFPGLFNGRKLGQAWDVTDPNPSRGVGLEDFFGWAANTFGGQGTYDYGTSGGGYPITSATTPQMAFTAANQFAAGNNLFSAIAEGASAPGKSGKRRRNDTDVLDELIQALQQGGAGAAMMNRRRLD